MGTHTRSRGRDLGAGFFPPLPTQARFLDSPAKYRLYSSGYGGGKSKSGCRESIRYAVTYRGTRNLVARYHLVDLKESTWVTFRRELAEIGFKQGTHYEFNRSDMLYRWHNGSETKFSNLDEEEKFGSAEYSTIFVDEGSEVPDGVYQVLFPGRLRWHLPTCSQRDPESVCGCPRRGWVCTNPGASGYLRAVTRGELTGWEWFAVPPGENIHNGPGYNEELAEKGRIYGDVWFKRYVQGDWDAFEGQRFVTFDRHRHVLTTDYHPTPDREIIVGVDFGFRNPTHFTWLAVDPRGEEPVVVFAEHEQAEWEVSRHVAEVRRINRDFGLDEGRIVYLGDPAGANVKSSGKSDIQDYSEHGIFIAPCRIGKNPQGRADHLSAFLNTSRIGEWGDSPAIVFSPRCHRTVSSVMNMRFKDQKSRLGEDPREAFLKQDDHGFDSLTYGLIIVPNPHSESRVRRNPVDTLVVPAGVNYTPTRPWF